jgi:hypothetical protein
LARRFHLHQKTTSTSKQRQPDSASWERTAQFLTFLIALTALLLHWAPQSSTRSELATISSPTNVIQPRRLIGQTAVESAAQNSSTTVGDNRPYNLRENGALLESSRERIAQTPIRLQVLNGCGIKGIARTITPALRSKNFDVREVRNAKHFRYDISSVIDRVGKPELAYAVADSLGIAHSQVSTEADPHLVDIDVTLIVGADYMRSELTIKSQ